MSMIAEQIAQLAAGAQDGPPAARWAVLQELAVATALEKHAGPSLVHFMDDPSRETVHGLRPVLTVMFDSPAEVDWWLGWFGYSPEANLLPLGTYSMLWRGWALAVAVRHPS